MTSLEQLQKNLAMIRNLKITEQELKDLNLALFDPETGLYCQQCKQCLPQCPHNVDIPTIMRSYMYAYGYKNTSQAYHNLETVDLSGRPCEKCESCSVNCASGFDVRNKIMDIARLRDVPKDFLIEHRS
jgi:predicted aldo/keto reductase-like oxidoreductase